MKRIKLVLLLLPWLPSLAFASLSSFGNPTGNGGTGGGGGSGGSSSLEVMSNGVRVSSPTATINFGSADFVGTFVAASTASITLSPLNAAIKTFGSSITVTNGSGLNVTYGAILGSATVSNLNASQYVKTDSGKLLASQSGVPTSDLSGTLQATQFPALTGDITTSAGALATTATGLQNNIKTFGSSITVTNPLGENVAYGLISGSVTVSNLNASQYVKTDSGKVLASQSGVPTTDLSGTLQATQFPALTGDVTTSAGALAATASAIQNNIKTFGSSVTITNSLGENVTYGLISGSATVNNITSLPVQADGSHNLYGALISLSSGVVGTVPAANLPTDVAYYDKTQTWTALQTHSQAGIVVTSTAGITNSYGIVTSTVNVSSNTVLSGTTFYQDGNSVLGKVIGGTWNGATVGVAYGGTNLTAAADDNVMVGDGSTWQTKAVPNCADSSGNHLNYTAASNAFSCGTTSSGSGTPGGSSSNVQYNNAGVFGGSSTFTTDGSSVTVSTGIFTAILKVPNLSNPVLTATGQIAWDTGTSSATLIAYDGPMARVATIPRVIFTSAPFNDVLVSSTITTNPTAFNTQFTFPANFWSVGKMVRVTYSRQYVATATIPTGQFTLRFQKSGPTNVNIAQNTASAPSGTGTYNGTVIFYTLVCTATGGTGTIIASSLAGGPSDNQNRNIIAQPIAFDTTAAQALQLLYTFGANSNANFEMLLHMSVEELN